MFEWPELVEQRDSRKDSFPGVLEKHGQVGDTIWNQISLYVDLLLTDLLECLKSQRAVNADRNRKDSELSDKHPISLLCFEGLDAMRW